MIDIDYNTLTVVVIGLFALVGFTRGWLREAFTTLLFMALVFMLSQPELAGTIISAIGRIITAVLRLFTQRIPSSALQGLVSDIGAIFDVENQYGFMVLFTIFLILISYMAGQRALSEGRLAPLSRLLGGTLGAVNGFIVLSLLREYILATLGIDTTSPAVRAAGAVRTLDTTQQVAVRLTNMPVAGLMSGLTPFLLFAFGFVLLVFFMREVNSRRARAKK